MADWGAVGQNDGTVPTALYTTLVGPFPWADDDDTVPDSFAFVVGQPQAPILVPPLALKNDGPKGPLPSLFVDVVINVVIPAPCVPIVVGPPITGEHIVGECVGADSYTDYALALDGGPVTLTVEEAPPLDLIVVVEQTGRLDLPAVTATLLNERNFTLSVDSDQPLALAGDTGTLLTERNVLLQAGDQPLALDGGQVLLTIEVILRILVDAVIPLELDGGTHVVVNPVLMPDVCLDLDLEALVCLHDGELTILNTFASGERVLLGSTWIWLRPLSPADCLDLALVGSAVLDLDAAPSSSLDLDLAPVGCDER